MTYRRAISRRRYLTSRHFYKSVDIDEVAGELKDPRPESGQLGNSFLGLLGAGGLEKAFEALSEGQRQTLWLHFFEGYTLDEIARKTRPIEREHQAPLLPWPGSLEKADSW